MREEETEDGEGEGSASSAQHHRTAGPTLSLGTCEYGQRAVCSGSLAVEVEAVGSSRL